MAESGEERKILLRRVKEDNIQKLMIMASNPFTSLQIEGKEVETVTEFIFLVSINTVDNDFTMILKYACSLKRKQ